MYCVHHAPSSRTGLLNLELTTAAPSMLQVRNEKARRFLLNMRKKPGVNFTTYFPRADPGAVTLLRRMLSFDPADRPTSEVCSSPHPLLRLARGV